MFYGKKSIINRPDGTDLASNCDTDSDLSNISGEIEELEKSDSDMSDRSIDGSDDDQADTDVATGRDNRTE